ncbi:hypothetical protein D3C76_1193760 [compost metagenome]
MAEQAEGLALQLDDGEVEQAELRRPLPAAGAHGVAVVGLARRQVEQQHQGVLRHRRRAVALAVADHDAPLAGGGEVDVVGAGGGEQDQLQLRALANAFGVDEHLVADRHLGALQVGCHVAGGGLVVQQQFAEGVVQRLHVEVAEVEGCVVEKHGARAVHGWLYLLRRVGTGVRLAARKAYSNPAEVACTGRSFSR